MAAPAPVPVPIPAPIPASVVAKPLQLSPWAARFGQQPVISRDDTLRRYGVQHSGVAPEPHRTNPTTNGRPRLSPVYYADWPAQSPGVFANLDEIDRFYLSEEVQHRARFGVQAWQAGVMFRHVQFSNRGIIPGGHLSSLDGDVNSPDILSMSDIHSQVMDMEMIQVDESKWFTFLRRERWLDVSGQPEALLGNTDWSIDHPDVWKHMSVILELANRMLTALVDDKHHFIHTVLYGILSYWNANRDLAPPEIPASLSDDTTVLLSWAFFNQNHGLIDPSLNLNPVSPPDDTSPEDWRSRLESLASDQQWTFLLDADSCLGITFPNLGGLIGFSSLSLKSLIRGDITLAERCHLYLLGAGTVLHELMHALVVYRINEPDPILNKLNINPYDLHREPFVDFDGAAELGYAMELRVWGGDIFHFLNTDVDTSRPLIPFGPIIQSWPWPWYALGTANGFGISMPGHPSFAAGTEIHRELMPAVYASALLSSAFWDNDTISRKSDRFFHRPTYFRSVDNFVPGKDTYPLPFVDQERISDEEQNNAPLTEIYQDMVKAWEVIGKAWADYRAGWYDQLKGTWDQTPWSGYYWRRQLQCFKKAFGEMNQVEAAGLAFVFANSAWNGYSSRAQYTDLLRNNPHLWLWHSIGLLMYAALPITFISQDVTINSRVRSMNLRPSSQAIGKLSERVHQYWGDDGGMTTKTLEASVIFDPLNRDGQIPATVTQHDYLNLLRSLIGHLSDTDKPMSNPWLREVLRVEQSLRAERDIMIGLYGGVTALNMWSTTFDFVVPEYDPKDVVVWHDPSQTWANVA
ncbi:hypothetical protein F5Y16DRAFT_403263 [Xylariaceae sp. FL0255]|nr:hypothetical protein F5Y16DRAFT_403263 [Xylariaceae sp. FL0255]